MNKKRQAIYDKSGGVCWYCGCELPKSWHVDHFHPIIRRDHSWMSKEAKELLGAEGCDHPERDTEYNKVPSCPSCNLMKSRLSIEDFRKCIEGFMDSLNKYTNQYKFAKKYGMIKETGSMVTFWFERYIDPQYEAATIIAE